MKKSVNGQIVEVDENEIQEQRVLGEKIEFVNLDNLDIDSESKKKMRYESLTKIIKDKTIGLMRLAINKPYLKDQAAVEAQYNSYEELKKMAEKGLFSEEENQAIIAANDAAKAKVAPLLKLKNEVRSFLEKKIEDEAENVDELLYIADSFDLDTVDENTSTKIDEFKVRLGL